MKRIIVMNTFTFGVIPINKSKSNILDPSNIKTKKIKILLKTIIPILKSLPTLSINMILIDKYYHLLVFDNLRERK